MTDGGSAATGEEAATAEVTGEEAAETGAESATGPDDGGSTYRGLLGAVPYAFRASDSRLFRSYAVIGGLAALAVALLTLGSVVVILGNTFRAQGGVFTFSRTFIIVVGLAVFAPVIAPVLLVARRHRRRGSTIRYDRAMGAAGYAFLAAVYLALVISAPPGAREAPPAVIAPVVEALYALPQLAGLVPLVLGAALIIAVHRRYREV